MLHTKFIWSAVDYDLVLLCASGEVQNGILPATHQGLEQMYFLYPGTKKKLAEAVTAYRSPSSDGYYDYGLLISERWPDHANIGLIQTRGFAGDKDDLKIFKESIIQLAWFIDQHWGIKVAIEFPDLPHYPTYWILNGLWDYVDLFTEVPYHKRLHYMASDSWNVPDEDPDNFLAHMWGIIVDPIKREKR